jgi:hypothetical protein
MMADLKKERNTPRRGEQGAIPPRSRRYYNNGKEWFFITRDGKHHGPYQHFTEAEAALKLYLRRCGIVKFAS